MSRRPKARFDEQDNRVCCAIRCVYDSNRKAREVSLRSPKTGTVLTVSADKLAPYPKLKRSLQGWLSFALFGLRWADRSAVTGHIRLSPALLADFKAAFDGCVPVEGPNMHGDGI